MMTKTVNMVDVERDQHALDHACQQLTRYADELKDSIGCLYAILKAPCPEQLQGRTPVSTPPAPSPTTVCNFIHYVNGQLAQCITDLQALINQLEQVVGAVKILE